MTRRGGWLDGFCVADGQGLVLWDHVLFSVSRRGVIERVFVF